MALDVVVRELHRGESALARELLGVADRHRAESEVYHVALDLAAWSQDHVRQLADAARAHGIEPDGDRGVGPGDSGWPGEPDGVLPAVLADLRRLHGHATGVALDWELLEQGARAVKDVDLLDLARRCRPRTRRQVTWADAMAKTLAPQLLAG
ncbi:hypothetical protein ACFS2C_16075 [Prauserella oleivorans]|uniref:DUF222 domain-containing protein n=1 Tax=Prauserella oleivorans TaxID=1478153 RepID=A0ABW5WCN0_9PSEU